MKSNLIKQWSAAAVAAIGLMGTTSGCVQSTVGGQTLPSGYYLRDDVQYFPAGPEFKLTNQVRALEEYKLQQEGIGAGPAAGP